MKTKIVYVVTSNDQDCFLEQCWASAYSAKIFTPDCHIIILTDKETKSGILSSERKNILSVVDEIIDVEIPAEFGKMERSRWLKTSIRKHIEGDFLYIDCDTLICDDLSDADDLDCIVGGVIDRNVPLRENKSLPLIKRRLQKAFSLNVNFDSHYINSGVLYVKDDDIARNFFDLWHNNWLLSRKHGIRIDQPSLYEAELESEKTKITELDGVWNAQIEGTLRYFYDAKILHFFSKRGGEKLIQFFGCEPYKQIKIDRGISTEMDERIRNFKRYFLSAPSIIIFGDSINYKSGKSFCVLNSRLSNIFTAIVKLFVK